MEFSCQEKNPLLELIKEQMVEYGWVKKMVNRYKKKLAEESGVKQSNISRFFNGRGINHKNLYLILDTLNLLKADKNNELLRVYKRLSVALETINELNKEIKTWEKRWKKRYNKRPGIA